MQKINGRGNFGYALNGTRLTATHLVNGVSDGNVILVQHYTPGQLSGEGIGKDAAWRIAA